MMCLQTPWLFRGIKKSRVSHATLWSMQRVIIRVEIQTPADVYTLAGSRFYERIYLPARNALRRDRNESCRGGGRRRGEKPLRGRRISCFCCQFDGGRTVRGTWRLKKSQGKAGRLPAL